MEEMKTGLPDWTQQVGLKLPHPECYILLRIRGLQLKEKSRRIKFERLKEVTPKLDEQELADALDSLKQGGLVDFVKTGSAYLDIKLTYDGRISAANHGQVMGQSPIVNVGKGNVAVGSNVGNQAIIENSIVLDSFNQVYNEVEKIQDKEKKEEVKKIVEEIEGELKKTDGKISIVKKGLLKLKELGQQAIVKILAEMVKQTIGL